MAVSLNNKVPQIIKILFLAMKKSHDTYSLTEDGPHIIATATFKMTLVGERSLPMVILEYVFSPSSCPDGITAFIHDLTKNPGSVGTTVAIEETVTSITTDDGRDNYSDNGGGNHHQPKHDIRAAPTRYPPQQCVIRLPTGGTRRPYANLHNSENTF